MKKYLILIQLILIVTATSCFSSQPRGTHIPGKPYHHITGGFRKPPGSIENTPVSWEGVWTMAKRVPGLFSSQDVPDDLVISPADALKQFTGYQDRDSITWIGQLTAIIRLDRQIILIDPWFSEKVGPARRSVPPPIALNQLPQIDIVVISHDHADHLDINTLEQLSHPEKVTVLVPLGVGRYFAHIKFKRVIELDWDQTELIDGIKYTALPAVHMSGTMFSNQWETLWAAWSIEGATGKKLFYTESDYGECFKQIGKKYGPFNIAIMSVGAYLPRVHNAGLHCIPENCVQICLDIKAENLIPVHYATLEHGGAENFLESGEKFRKAALEKGIPENNIWMLKIGETREF
ncbi:MBL fold metallo-hydrolase [bacterium]|nr:MBL fold metallo-hydrolase [bacterium]